MKLTHQKLLSGLRNGVQRSSDVIARITDYHGGPITTEYLLTSDIARQLIEQNYEIEVEYLYRNIVNGMTSKKNINARRNFGLKRTDIAVLRNDYAPLAIILAIIEVKIGVKTLRGIAKDLVKITYAIDALKPLYASGVWGASVFQVHISGSDARHTEQQFRDAIAATEKRLKANLADHERAHSGYRFSFHSLQSANEGYMATETELDGDVWALGQHGQATRFYAVLIKSKISKPKLPRTFAELKADALA